MPCRHAEMRCGNVLPQKKVNSDKLCSCNECYSYYRRLFKVKRNEYWADNAPICHMHRLSCVMSSSHIDGSKLIWRLDLFEDAERRKVCRTLLGAQLQRWKLQAVSIISQICAAEPWRFLNIKLDFPNRWAVETDGGQVTQIYLAF